ncbi:hypothetical protein D3C74_450880 [compost metagenome]
MELLHHARFAKQVADSVRCLRTVLKPCQCFIFIDLNNSRLFNRVVVTDLLDKTTVTWGTGIRYHYAVERSFVSTHTFQTNTNCHLKIHLLQ